MRLGRAWVHGVHGLCAATKAHTLKNYFLKGGKKPLSCCLWRQNGNVDRDSLLALFQRCRHARTHIRTHAHELPPRTPIIRAITLYIYMGGPGVFLVCLTKVIGPHKVARDSHLDKNEIGITQLPRSIWLAGSTRTRTGQSTRTSSARCLSFSTRHALPKRIS